MSASLLRKGLELLGEPAQGLGGGHWEATVCPAVEWAGRDKIPGLGPNGASLFPGSRTGPGSVRGPQSRIPEKRSSRKNQATIKGKVTKSALEEFQKRQRQDHLQENLRFMRKKLVAADPTITTKILLQNHGRKAKDRPATKQKKEKPQGTVFTEEDFRKFQEEYFGNSGTK